MGGGGLTGWLSDVAGSGSKVGKEWERHGQKYDYFHRGTDPGAPGGPSELDQILMKNAQDEADFNALIRPELLKQAGLTEVDEGSWETRAGYDKPVWVGTGKKIVRPMTEEEKIALMTPEEKTSYDLDKAASERAVKAAAGTLEVDPTVKANLDEQKLLSDALIRRRLGAKGAALSTPGIKSNSLTQENAVNVMSNFAHGEENTGLSLLNGGRADLFNQNATLLNGGNGLVGMGIQSQTVPDNVVNLNRQGNLMQKQNQTAFQGGLLNLAGTGAGLLLSQ